MDDLDAVVQEKLDGDSEFHSSIASLSDEEKTSAIETKRRELVNSEFKSLKEKAEAAKEWETKFNDQKVRAEKAESKIKESKEDSLSAKDILALNQSGVHAEDIDEVLDFAKYKKTSIVDALKNPTLKTILSEKQAQRETALATNTRKSQSANDKTGETLLNQASDGKVPTDDDGINELARARMETRLSRLK